MQKSQCQIKSIDQSLRLPLRERSPYLELFWSKCGKIQTRITTNTDTFYAVYMNLDKKAHYKYFHFVSNMDVSQ